MLIQYVVSVAGKGFNFARGDIREVSKTVGKKLIKIGHAVEFSDDDDDRDDGAGDGDAIQAGENPSGDDQEGLVDDALASDVGTEAENA
ncbi:MAG: hypothetical protein AAGB02_03120 [Pseudomonadota bacterium]